MTANPGEVPLLPYNSGIPLSSSNPQNPRPRPVALPKGVEDQDLDGQAAENNLFANHNQLGANSSDEEKKEQDSLEEVEVYMPNSEEDRDRDVLHPEGDRADTINDSNALQPTGQEY